MRKMLTVWALALLLGLSLMPAQAENTAILGQPFPDFTVETTDGEIFTLSEALKEKQAVLINLWASWCGPCRVEFPYLDEAYAQRAEDIAVVALSVEEEDSLQDIADFKADLGLSFPMGRDEGGTLGNYVQAYYIPTTVVVDRFGNACFLDSGAMVSADQFLRLMDAFRGEDYAQSRVLSGVPAAKTWRVRAEADIRAVRLMNLDDPEDHTDFPILSAPGDRAALAFELVSGDAAGDFLHDGGAGKSIPVEELYDEGSGAYVYDASVPEADDFAVLELCTAQQEQLLTVVLVRGEAGIDALRSFYEAQGLRVGWEYAEE